LVDLTALSDREREVLDLALTGLSAGAIAERLTLTEATIRSHLSRIYAKLGVGGRVELLVQLKGQAPAERYPSSSPSVEPAPPRRRRRRVWPVAALAVLLVISSAGALFLSVRPDLPPSTNLATVSQLVAQGQAASLDLRGDTLTVTTKDGSRYRVDGVDEAGFSEILLPKALGSNVEVSISSGDTLTLGSIAALVSAFAPLILLLAVALVVFRWLRRQPQPRLAG
jgi:DNA-binding CsgD family transcriptional regulator